jgi:diguanylate cyclase (GGDEF)-like protein
VTAPGKQSESHGDAKMYCEQVQALISARLDGEIPARERELLDIHLGECPACRSTLESRTLQDRQLRVAFAAHQPSVARVADGARARLSARFAPRCSVLLVDDETYILAPLRSLLAEEFEVLTAGSADAAQMVLESRPIDVVLTDQRMPGRTGTALLEWTRQHAPRTIRLLMTGFSELEDAVEAINRGHVYHYLLKPWRTQDVLQTLRNAADKFTLERKRERYLEELRELNRELEHRVAVRTQELEEANFLLLQRSRELERLALSDPLTGLFNRRAMDELARFELKRHSRFPSPLAVGYIDVDHFKRINTEYLLTGGDEVLKGLARLLSSCVREVDSVGRIGGEEFLVIARETGMEGAAVLAERIRATVEATPIRYHGQPISITVSVGFAVAEIGVPADFTRMTELAAAALGSAKQCGRNRCEVRFIHEECEAVTGA